MNSSSDASSTKLWVFGYGSLCWQPGFEFSNHQLGYIRGFSRKFWQGNTSHRGTEQKVFQLNSNSIKVNIGLDNLLRPVALATVADVKWPIKIGILSRFFQDSFRILSGFFQDSFRDLLIGYVVRKTQSCISIFSASSAASVVCCCVVCYNPNQICENET